MKTTLKLKLIGLASLLLSAATPFFAYEGMMAGEKDLRIARTAHFEIIFPERSRQSAKILFEKAEDVYRDVAAAYRLPHDFSLPVVLAPSQDEFNGYFSFAPFNHIVINDTVPESNLAVFSENLISVFRHELTHAISYNMHGGFWYGVKKTLGDSYNPGILTTTTAWAEGAAVSSESAAGEGRLNDEFSLHLVKQAKLEEKFPRYSEVNGTKDTYPYTRQSYAFGGAFNAWLQKTYGMEKYAEFWYRCVNLRTLTYFMCFKQTYGLPIAEAWERFRTDVHVPDIPSSPLQNDWCAAFDGRTGSHTSLTSCRTGFAYYDAYSSAVNFVKNGGGKAKRLFKMTNVSRIALSADGRFLAVSYTSYAGANAKHKVRVYDTEKKRFFALKEAGLRDAAVFQSGDEYYLAAVRTENQNAPLVVYALKNAARGSTAAERIAFVKHETQKFAFSPVGSEDGSVYYVYKDGMTFSLRAYNIFTKQEAEFRLPVARAVIRNLNAAGDGKISFSWTKPESMPRLGVFTADGEGGASFLLQEDDCSGGVFSPAFVESGGADEKRAVYIGSFFGGTKLLFADANKMNLTRINAASSAPAPFDIPESGSSRTDGSAPLHSDGTDSEGTAAGGNEDAAPKTRSPLPNEKPFSLVKYGFTHKGTVVPFSLLTSTQSISADAQRLGSTPLPFGVTYVSSSPWTSPIWGVSASYSFLTNSGALAAQANGGTQTALFKYAAKAQAEFDRAGYKQAFTSADTTCKIPAGKTAYLKFANAFRLFEGRQTSLELPPRQIERMFSGEAAAFNLFGILETGEKTQRLFASDKATAAFGNITKAGKEFYEYSGAEIAFFYAAHYAAPISAVQTPYSEYQNIGLAGKVEIPRLLPIRNADGWTNNLPLTLEAALFPAQNYYASAKASAVLFAKEIQWAPNTLPLLYANRFALSASYLAKLGAENPSTAKNTIAFAQESTGQNPVYSDELAFKAALTLSPDISGAAKY
ncbi:MAG: hypothetical protein ACTTKL_10860, partial [Treponema sp.]